MSPSIWTRCAARSKPLAGTFRRVVESQFINSTRKLVDDDAEQALLEELIDTAKLPVPLGFENLHYLLYTPFRHPPLRNGSRFGTRAERGILYGSRELPTAFAEVAYYRLLFLEGTAADLGTVQVELTAFKFGIDAAKGIDLTRKPFAEYTEQISSPTNYGDAQELGREMRAAGVECALYVSARAEQGANLAVFANVFSPRKPSGEERWSCAVSKLRVEFRSASLIGAAEIIAFDRSQFLIDGRLPAPAF